MASLSAIAPQAGAGAVRPVEPRQREPHERECVRKHRALVGSVAESGSVAKIARGLGEVPELEQRLTQIVEGVAEQSRVAQGAPGGQCLAVDRERAVVVPLLQPHRAAAAEQPRHAAALADPVVVIDRRSVQAVRPIEVPSRARRDGQ